MSEAGLVYKYGDYREYLAARLPISGADRGSRSRLASALGCQTAFVSQVLHGEANFSLEHAIGVSQFLGHTEAEEEYFMALVHLARAGTAALGEYFQRRLKAIRDKRELIAERIGIHQNLPEEALARYYSTWHYAAIHILCAIPAFQSSSALAAHLHVPERQVREMLEFLCAHGLVIERVGGYGIGQARTHLPRSSPLIARHHCNWRLRAMMAQDLASEHDKFFSGPVALTEQDAKRLREMILKFLESVQKAYLQSGREAVFCLNLDFFRV